MVVNIEYNVNVDNKDTSWNWLLFGYWVGLVYGAVGQLWVAAKLVMWRESI